MALYMKILKLYYTVKPTQYILYTYVSLQIHFLLTTCSKNIMLNEKNKLKNTNNVIPKMLDRLKHVDYWRHL